MDDSGIALQRQEGPASGGAQGGGAQGGARSNSLRSSASCATSAAAWTACGKLQVTIVARLQIDGADVYVARYANCFRGSSETTGSPRTRMLSSRRAAGGGGGAGECNRGYDWAVLSTAWNDLMAHSVSVGGWGCVNV